MVARAHAHTGLVKAVSLCGAGNCFGDGPVCETPVRDVDITSSAKAAIGVGAIMINTAVTEAVFGALFIGTLLLTAPEVPWQPLLAVALATNGIFPWIFYPHSKTIWMAVDLYFLGRSGPRAMSRGG